MIDSWKRRVAALTLGVLTTGAGGLAATADAASRTARSSATASGAAGGFVALSPTRVLDTRSGNGAAAAPVAGLGSLTVQVAGRGGVPSSGVSAVLLTVTAVSPSTAGYLTAYPAGGERPTASNLNFAARQTVANLVAVPLGAGGRVTLANGSRGAVDLLADVAGYYREGTPSEAGAFAALTPARLLDTRNGTGTTPGRVPGRGSASVLVAGQQGVPATGVSAVLLTVTAVRPSGSGFLTTYPSGTAAPTASTLNFVSGQTVANLVAVPVGADGRVAIDNGSSGSTDLVADVAGYYVGGTPTADGMLVPRGPTRLLDTRSGNGATTGPVSSGGTLTVQVGGRGDVPSTGVSAVLLNVTAVGPGRAGYLTAYPAGAVRPTASNLNFAAGRTTANLVAVPVSADGRVALYNGSGGSVHLLADLAGYVLADSATEPDDDPPGGVTGLQVSATTTSSITLSWTDPADQDLQGVMVRRAVGLVPPSSPTSGTLVADVAAGTQTVTDTGLSAGVIYSYAVFAHDAVPNYSAGATKTATPAIGPIGAVVPLGTVDWTKSAVYDGGNWATPDVVHTYPAGDGRVGVVTYHPSSSLLSVETADPSTHTRVGTARTISLEGWPSWGGFVAAPDGSFYVLVGRDNPTQDDALDVAAIRHYDASWNLLGTAYVKGGASQGTKGIYSPFDAGAPKMAVVGQKLVVHMCRLMYADLNGTHHQGNLTVEVDPSTMTARTFQSLGVVPGVTGYAYSSHSFQQLVTSSGSSLVVADQGDAFPRAIQVGVTRNYPTNRLTSVYEVFPINGAIGANVTGVSLTGIGSGASGVVLAGTSVPQPNAPLGTLDATANRNVFVVAVNPDTGARTVRWLTSFSPSGTTEAKEPRMVSLGSDRFALLFTVLDGSTTRTEYRLIDSAGTVLAQTTFPALAYDAGNDPVAVGGKIYWAGRNGGGSTGYLYGLDVSDPTHPAVLS